LTMAIILFNVLDLPGGGGRKEEGGEKKNKKNTTSPPRGGKKKGGFRFLNILSARTAKAEGRAGKREGPKTWDVVPLLTFPEDKGSPGKKKQPLMATHRA